MGKVGLGFSMPPKRKATVAELVDELHEFWHLPSKDELHLMYTNLHVEGVGGFSNNTYWSSSEIHLAAAMDENFNSGFQGGSNKDVVNWVRACRAFIAGAGEYSLRDVGPGGGLIFYVNGTDYLEAAASDQSSGKTWSNVIDKAVETTGTAIGTGRANTLAIIAQAGGADDWFLPSESELLEMFNNLHDQGVGGFSDEEYWCSTEVDAVNAYSLYFGGAGESTEYSKAQTFYVRACRSFPYVMGAYNLRDTGPAGGLIFYNGIAGTFEAAPADQSAGKYWSNIQDTLIGTTSSAIGEGENNTDEIIAQAGHTDSAAKLCKDLDDIWGHIDSAARLCDDLNIFESTWKTDNVGTSGDDEITLPLLISGTYAFNVDWGDTTSDWIDTWNQAEITHIYAGGAGTYTVKITGICDGWAFNNGFDMLKLLIIVSWGRLTLGSSNGFFHGCANLVVSATDRLRTGAMTSFNNAFNLCSSLTSLAARNWDLSSVVTLQNAFSSCALLATIDVSKWDTSQVFAFGSMFWGCSSLIELDVSNWDVGEGLAFNSTFYNCSTLTELDTSNWNPVKATSLFGMFRSCTNLAVLDVSGWDVGACANFGDMFQDCTSIDNLDVSAWDVGEGQFFEYMFKGCSALTYLDVSLWDTSKSTTFEYTFGLSLLIVVVGMQNWNVALVTNMNYMLRNKTLPTVDYDAILIAWEAQSVQSGFNVDFGNGSLYTPGGAAETARTNLINDHTWAITDGGPV